MEIKLDRLKGIQACIKEAGQAKEIGSDRSMHHACVCDTTTALSHA